MRTTERIIDYIKSWLYYPKMRKYFESINLKNADLWRKKMFPRFSYAWWHCKHGKLKAR